MATHAANLTNLVYLFAVETVEASDVESALSGADVQESDADPIKEAKTVRIGSSASTPEVAGEGLAKEFNGVLAVEFVAVPISQEILDRVDARETAHQMAMEFITALGNSRSLNNRGCYCAVTGKEDGYRNINTGRCQVSVITIRNNPE